MRSRAVTYGSPQFRARCPLGRQVVQDDRRGCARVTVCRARREVGAATQIRLSPWTSLVQLSSRKFFPGSRLGYCPAFHPKLSDQRAFSRGYSSRCGRLVASPVELALLAGYGAFLCQCSKTAEHLAETGTSASLVRGRASTDEGRADTIGRCRARQRQAPVQAANATEKGEKNPTIRAQNIIELANRLVKAASGLRPNH